LKPTLSAYLLSLKDRPQQHPAGSKQLFTISRPGLHPYFSNISVDRHFPLLWLLHITTQTLLFLKERGWRPSELKGLRFAPIHSCASLRSGLSPLTSFTPFVIEQLSGLSQKDLTFYFPSLLSTSHFEVGHVPGLPLAFLLGWHGASQAKKVCFRLWLPVVYLIVIVKCYSAVAGTIARHNCGFDNCS
jgi:hypothetical protein